MIKYSFRLSCIFHGTKSAESAVNALNRSNINTCKASVTPVDIRDTGTNNIEDINAPLLFGANLFPDQSGLPISQTAPAALIMGTAFKNHGDTANGGVCFSMPVSHKDLGTAAFILKSHHAKGLKATKL